MAKFRGTELTLTVGGTNVGQITALPPAGSSRGLIDASVYGDDFKDYLIDQEDGDEMQVEVAYDPVGGGITSVENHYAAKTQGTYQVDHDDADMHLSFPALVTQFARGGARDGLLTATFTLKIVSPGISDLSS